MSNHTINNNNNKVILATSPMDERHPVINAANTSNLINTLTTTIATNIANNITQSQQSQQLQQPQPQQPTPQPIIIPPQPTIAPIAFGNNINYNLPAYPYSLNLPQYQLPITNPLSAPAQSIFNNNKTLNPNANTFNPYSMAPISSLDNITMDGVQGYKSNVNASVFTQLQRLQTLLHTSLIKLQILSNHLNQLNVINQQSQTVQSLQQYQSAYSQYQIEFTTSLILNQSIANLQQNINTLTQNNNNNNNDNNDNKQDNNKNISGITPPPPKIMKLETIEEGEEEDLNKNNSNNEVNDDDDAVIAIADNNALNKVVAIASEGLDDINKLQIENINKPNNKMEDNDDDIQNQTESQEQLEQKNDIELEGPMQNETGCDNYNILLSQAAAASIAAADKLIIGKKLNKEGPSITSLNSDFYGYYGKEFVLKKRIRGILNKITPENFDKLAQEIASIIKLVDIEVCDANNLNALLTVKGAKFKVLIKLILKCILEKSITDKGKYSNQYARLCYSLYLRAENDELHKKLFNQQLVSLCHGIFKKSRKSLNNVRFIGIITMIGSLFSFGLISWKIISSGIFNELLPPKNELDIEGICKLLKVSGNDFDRHHYDEINEVLKKLKKYSNEKKYSFRIKCLVQNIDEMRSNKWKQRIISNGNEKPKTLNQIKKDFNKERITRNNNNYNKYQNNNNNHQSRFGRQYPSNSYSRHNNNNARSSYNNNQNRWGNHNDNNYRSSSYSTYSNNNNNNNNQKRRKNLRPTVEFVRDVTLPDRSHYDSNKVLTKTWKMRNSGELSWGNNVELVYFKGDESLSLESRYPVIDAQPGQEVEISATIRTPITPGRYCTYFRLHKNGKFFGPRVWVDIIVKDIKSSGDHTKNSATKMEADKSNILCCQT